MKSNKRYPNSLFDQVCQFINSQEIGSTFTVQKLYNSCNENLTSWKRRNNDPGYVTRLYAGQLRNAGVLVKNKRGTWTVLAHVPDHVTLDMINTHLPWDKKWKVANEYFGPEQPIESSLITIYKIVDKHVEPADVLKTQVGALLSTGDYFEDEMDAWYFLSVGTGIAVESLKDTWKKTQDFANDIVEHTESHLDQEEDEIIERLDGLLRIISLTDAENTKFIYGFNGENGPLTKAKVASYLVVANDDIENESLKRLLQLKAGHKMPWTIFAEEILESIENGDYYKEEVIPVVENADDKIHTNIMLAMDNYKESVKNASPNTFITFEDIRGKEVYFKNNSNVWNRATILGVQMEALHNGTPKFTNVHVKYMNSDATSWIPYSTIKLSKEEVLQEVTNTINSL